MEILSKLFTEWGGAPLLLWIVGIVVLIFLIASRVPFRVRKTKEEFTFESRLPPEPRNRRKRRKPRKQPTQQ